MSDAHANQHTAIVIPTIGRPSLRVLLTALAADTGPLPREIVIVDDRRNPSTPLDVEVPTRLRHLVRVVRGRAAGPAAARNDGWHAAEAEWISFLDDDVVPGPNWLAGLVADLSGAGENVAGVAGRIVVPLPKDRRPTDWERNTAGLQNARWATADLAFRRGPLIDVAGFDERFKRAYREDADLALRLRNAGYNLQIGSRHVVHPVRPAGPWISVAMQKGNADDALMRALHGTDWQARAQVFKGRRRRHIATTAAAAAAALLALAGRRRPAATSATAWLCWTASFATERILPGPRDVAEVTKMVLTSIVIPPAATAHWLKGLWRWRHAGPWPDRPAAVLFDRDGTLVRDVPYNGDPDLVVPHRGAREALDVLRAHGVRLGVVSNQSGVARGHLTAVDVEAVNARVAELLGPIDVFRVCVHDDAAGCDCRKPAPGLITSAAEALGVHPKHCVVIGDIASDVRAAANAGARGILVPTPQTRHDEIAAAAHVVADLGEAVRLALDPQFLTDGGRR